MSLVTDPASMDLRLKNKVILVSASSRGLGYGIARACSREGARVSVCSRSQESVDRAVGQIHQETDADVLGCMCDVTSPDDLHRWIGESVRAFGGVDGLVVNTGGPPAGRFDDLDDGAWQSACELILLSCVRMVRLVLPFMRGRGGGSILAVTSSTVKEPADDLILSNVMRSGVTSLVKSLARTLAADRIRVNSIAPHRFDTDRVRSLDQLAAAGAGSSPGLVRQKMTAEIPLGRYGTIEEFGAAGAFLLSDAASYVTGQCLVVDGGATRTVW